MRWLRVKLALYTLGFLFFAFAAFANIQAELWIWVMVDVALMWVYAHDIWETEDRIRDLKSVKKRIEEACNGN
jgi:hypothetical protein